MIIPRCIRKACYRMAILLLALPGVLQAQDSLITRDHPGRTPTSGEILEWKETFTYEVRFSFFRLGEVQVEVVGDTLFRGKKAWWLRTKITSNSSIPFVGHEENHYNSFVAVDDSMPYTLYYWRDNVDEEEYMDTIYDYDYDAGLVYIVEPEGVRDTLALDEPSSSGQLILLYSRLFAGSGRTYTMPVYLEREKGYIVAQNSPETDRREYDAFEGPVETYYSRGDADVQGPFGFRGRFEAWFLNDDLRVPVEARMKVWLGNVKVRLTEYKKTRRQ